MIFKKQAEEDFNIQAAEFPEMESLINKCANIYRSVPYWLDDKNNIKTINFAKSVCSETARLATLAIGIQIDGSARATWLQEQIDKVYFQIRHWVEYGCAYGTVFIKPNGESLDVFTPADVMIVDASGNKAVPAVINLTVDDWNAKTVVGVEKPADLKVKKGTAADKLDLPKTVNVTLEGGRVADVLEVKWTTDNYKADQIGTQTLSGELQKKKGVKIPDKFKTVTINVIVEESEVNPPQPEDKVVTKVEELTDLTVEFGTSVEKLALPTEVKVTLDNETEDKLSVEWNTDAYKADEAGTYELTGTLQAKEGIKLPDNFKTVTINVTVEEKGGEVDPPQPEDKVVIAVEKLADLTVKFGTPAEKLALPKEVKVTLDNKAKDKLSIVWNTDVYKADKAGTYKLTGTLQTKEGITIPEEFRKVTVNVTVGEKGKVP